jgi:hypothetical protein
LFLAVPWFLLLVNDGCRKVFRRLIPLSFLVSPNLTMTL